MKVLMPALHYYPVIGGIETWTRNIAERLSEKAEVFVVTGKVKGQPKKEERNGVKIWRTSLFTLSNLSASPKIYSLSLLPFIFFKSLNLVKKEKINIITKNVIEGVEVMFRSVIKIKHIDFERIKILEVENESATT